MANGTAFLDTSVIISREFGSRDIREKIDEVVEHLAKTTTSFAKKEVNCSLLKDAILLFAFLIEEENLPAVFNRLQRYPLTDRRRKRCLALLSKVSSGRQLRLADAITNLESLITGLGSLLFRDVSVIQSETNCPLAEARPEKNGRIYRISSSCRRDSAKCDLKRFLEKNKNNAKEISTQEDLDSTLAKLLCSILEDFSIARGRNCSILGDVIICLESPSSYGIYSTNINDFTPICRAIRKTFIGIKI